MIGKIVSIKNDIIYVKLSFDIYKVDNLIGKNVTFNKRYVGEISNISTEYAEINLVGEIINNIFIPGNMNMPPFGSVCMLTTADEINIIYGVSGNNNNNIVKIGQSFVYKNFPVCLNIDNFFANHFAILGNTGSGKSCFVSKLLQSVFSNQNKVPINSNIFLFDAYGEYQRSFENINKINSNLNYRVITTNLNEGQYEKLVIPFWFLSVDDICLLLNVDDIRQIPIIEKALKLVGYFCGDEEKVIHQKNDIVARTLLDVIFSGSSHSESRNKITTILSKFSTKNINLDINLTKGGWTRTIRQCISIDETGRFADIEIVISYLEQFCVDDMDLKLPDGSFMYTIKDYYDSLEFALISEGVFSSNRIFDYANILKVRLNSLINSDYVNYFVCNNYMNKNDFIKSLFYTGNIKYQIINFNINYVDDRFAKVLVKVYSRILFEYVTLLSDRASIPFHLILEEAHRYIQNDIDTKIIGYNIFDRIAKEGRKYGILLGVISQRPSELSETTISQCSNFAIFKLFHEPDVNFVSKSISGITRATIERIKMFTPGNCVLFGNAFKMPILTTIDLPNPMPYSDSCNISNTWYKN